MNPPQLTDQQCLTIWSCCPDPTLREGVPLEIVPDWIRTCLGPGAAGNIDRLTAYGTQALGPRRGCPREPARGLGSRANGTQLEALRPPFPKNPIFLFCQNAFNESVLGAGRKLAKPSLSIARRSGVILFRIGDLGVHDQANAVRLFEQWLFNSDDPHARWMRANLHLLRGRDLACWCKLDEPCHADVLLRLANGGLVAKFFTSGGKF
jgi:hypothetical protein